ncbi:hypothetical protein TEA_010274 [Camellia sinensis var. sinensis]|uniref:Uncharacterized protein n=1 Tax=Camellia sinensis var. sinensis TaxID=542762 RepID=A0A4S4DZW7_CAMSN|nr:hypothetical protein TEA_010274 [Camellia sinensis var. sinensis]
MVGTVCGIYIAQNYNVPNICKLANTAIFMAKHIEEKYCKPKKGDDLHFVGLQLEFQKSTILFKFGDNESGDCLLKGELGLGMTERRTTVPPSTSVENDHASIAVHPSCSTLVAEEPASEDSPP